MRTDSKTLATALRIAADEMISDDGVVPSAMYDAAYRIEELEPELQRLHSTLTRWADAKNGLDQSIDSRDPDECDYWHSEIFAAEAALMGYAQESDKC